MVAGGERPTTAPVPAATEPFMAQPTLPGVMARVCMGGTFDVIHKGHRALLETAFQVGDKGVFVGVTSDDMAHARRDRHVHDLDHRVEALQSFLEDRGWLDRAEVAPIDDIVGRALEPVFDTIVVSEETMDGADVVNRKRRDAGLAELDVVVAPLVLAEDGRRISATRIRREEIDGEGRLQRPLRVVVGSANPVKQEAVRRALRRAWDRDVTVHATEVASGVPDQPRGDDTVRGALARARRALEADPDADWGVGIEAGLLPEALLDDVLDVQVAAVLDRGRRVSLGYGPGFQYPPEVVRAVEEGATVGEAMSELAGTPGIGRKMGAIGHLTGGAMDRTELTEAAVLMALVPRLHPDAYRLHRLAPED